MHNISRLLLCLFLVLVITACAGGAAVPTLTPTHDPAPEKTSTAKVEEAAAEQASQTAAAQATQDFIAGQTADAQAAIDAKATEDGYATATKAQKDLDSQATRTQRAVEQITKTAEVILQETAQAEPLFDIAQLLFQNGNLSSPAGEYFSVSDYELDWAQLNYYKFWPILESVAIDTGNFVLRTDIAWSSASDNANWNYGGCGFAVYDMDTGKHHLMQLSMGGYANLFYNSGGSTASLRATRITNAQGIPSGEAEFVLAVQDQTITVYVNGEESYSFKDPKYMPGVLAYTLLSGTNKGFGTRCEWTNTALWELASDE